MRPMVTTQAPEPANGGMRARSIVFDLFGDYLRYRGGEARLLDLVILLDCFGIGESAARVTMARLRQEGWFETRMVGREAMHSLTERGWRLLDEGRERVFKRVQKPWDGEWHMVIYSVPESNRGLRDGARKALSWLGFGPLASSVWVSPHDRLAQFAARFGDKGTVQLDLLHCRTTGLSADREMCARCWDLPGLDRAYGELIGTYKPRMATYRAQQLEPMAALVERTQLIHDYRKFPFSDPDLPIELVPTGWQGRTAHEVFLEAHELLADLADRCVDDLLGPGSLPRSTSGKTDE